MNNEGNRRSNESQSSSFDHFGSISSESDDDSDDQSDDQNCRSIPTRTIVDIKNPVKVIHLIFNNLRSFID